ncbi:hypothetical protein TNCV_626591 [Trichonephila clavipes]|nr:hypothetical protein TNCV_626591 [Trichonephila clavipes]
MVATDDTPLSVHHAATNLNDVFSFSTLTIAAYTAGLLNCSRSSRYLHTGTRAKLITSTLVHSSSRLSSPQYLSCAKFAAGFPQIKNKALKQSLFCQLLAEQLPVKGAEIPIE